MSEEKNEQPTDKKIEDARKKGQVAVSRDLARVISLAAVMELALLTEKSLREAICSLIILSTSRIGQPFKLVAAELAHASLQLLFIVFLITFVYCCVVGVASYWGQFGILISTESLTPKFDKFNPVNNIKQLFSKKKLTELILSLLKAVLAGLILYTLIKQELPNIMQLAGGNPEQIYLGFVTITRTIFHVLIVVFLVIAVVDFAAQKYLHTQSLKMDMEEIKREHKESEGDPIIKSTRKQLARQWANENPVSKTELANALVVNPTHFAVAMLFDQTTPVPVVLAKGSNETARAMIARAQECGIPVIRHVWLARTLYASCKSNMVVPKSSYEAVAMVYAAISQLQDSSADHNILELERYGEPGQ